MPAEHVPVVVVGAGPTGASAAIMLGRRGVGCLVLERWPQVYPLPRAVHFDDEVFRTFASMGLQHEVTAISRPVPGMRLTDAGHRVLAEFTRDRRLLGHPQANMFDQPDLERVLRDALGRYPSVELRAGVEVCEIAQVAGGPAPVRVRYRAADPATGAGPVREVWADIVLGCDGANSLTRRVVGATMEDFEFEQQWLVVDVDSPEPLPGYDGVQQVCDHDRAATFMPVTPGRYRWEFRLRPGERPEDVDHAAVLELIEPWLSGVDVDKLTFLRQTCYTFRGVVADRWQNGRVFLLGDAAHQTPPFIGQGMCAGIRDAANLAWKVALVLQGHADELILRTYEAERRPYARRVVQLAIRIGWLMTGGTSRTARTRRALMRLAGRIPTLTNADLVWPAFPRGPLVRRGCRRTRVGHPCPQPRLRVGDDVVRLDQLLGPNFGIVYRGADRISAFDPATRDFFDRLGTTIVRLGDPATGAVEDLDGTLHALLDACHADAVLIRPDRIVAAAADTPDLRAWQRHLRSANITPPTTDKGHP